jgi:hypothetical protein
VSIRAKLAKPLNDALQPLHVQLVSGTSPDPAIQDCIPARKTIAAVQKAGLPLGAYIDQTFAEPGATPSTVKAMLELADLHDECETVCEIGPGRDAMPKRSSRLCIPTPTKSMRRQRTGCPTCASYPTP